LIVGDRAMPRIPFSQELAWCLPQVLIPAAVSRVVGLELTPTDPEFHSSSCYALSGRFALPRRARWLA
jgi:hypothetical protein